MKPPIVQDGQPFLWEAISRHFPENHAHIEILDVIHAMGYLWQAAALFHGDGWEQIVFMKSGVIEGACRHYVKDRMERADMRWTMEGAQAMLDVRSVALNEDWQEFMEFRIQNDMKRNHPHLSIVQTAQWPLAA